MSKELDTKVDAIIQRCLSGLNIIAHSEEPNKFNYQTKMIFACMFSNSELLIGEEDRAMLRKWLEETAMVV